MKIRLVIAISCLILLFHCIVLGEEPNPCSQDDALAAAQKLWVTFNESHTIASLHSMYGFSSKEDVLSCELRNGYQVVLVDYDSYEQGDDILKYIDTSLQGAYQCAFGFGVYLDNQQCGDIRVGFRQGEWTFMACGGYGELEKEGRYNVIFEKYPASAGYSIYSDLFNRFFIIKNATVISSFAISPGKKAVYVEKDPELFMLENKARIKAAKD